MMKNLLSTFFFFVPILTFAQISDLEIRNLKSGKVIQDASPIYHLPYQKGKSFWVIQGYNSSFSHKGEISLDFKMPIGTPIFSARKGKVVALRNDGKIGGLKQAYLSEGNFVQIAHEDGSIAIYWHLQENSVPVKIGDQVDVDTQIGRCGNTGYTAFPHLHFQVYDNQDNNIPTRFKTKKGIRYLRPLKRYKSI
jgi:murein DD-endopeptidase MepM/ murein hydrolase activator NlpD